MRQRPCVATNGGGEVLERAQRGGVHHAVDGHRAAGCIAAVALANAVDRIRAPRGRHLGHAIGDGDTAAGSYVPITIPVTGTDAGSICAARSRDGSARDDDVATSCCTTIGAYASATVATLCGDDAALDPDIAAG